MDPSGVVPSAAPLADIDHFPDLAGAFACVAGCTGVVPSDPVLVDIALALVTESGADQADDVAAPDAALWQ